MNRDIAKTLGQLFDTLLRRQQHTGELMNSNDGLQKITEVDELK
uniref:Uncharacterized protein n=1 Tax=Anguilla anguilla TaxID=7936 RepID=A0A0E9Q453_ANGAN